MVEFVGENIVTKRRQCKRGRRGIHASLWGVAQHSGLQSIPPPTTSPVGRVTLAAHSTFPLRYPDSPVGRGFSGSQLDCDHCLFSPTQVAVGNSFVCSQAGSWLLQDVMTWHPCWGPGHPEVYTSLHPFLSWILDRVSNCYQLVLLGSSVLPFTQEKISFYFLFFLGGGCWSFNSGPKP
jgi:hypothetical protein